MLQQHTFLINRTGRGANSLTLRPKKRESTIYTIFARERTLLYFTFINIHFIWNLIFIARGTESSLLITELAAAEDTTSVTDSEDVRDNPESGADYKKE